MKNAYILITGGAGFIGSHLAERLLSCNEKVIILDNFDSFYDRKIKEANLQGLQSFQPIFIEGDIRDPLVLEQIFSNYTIEMVVHLAAKAGVRPSIVEPNLYFDVNVNGTIQILEMMKKYHCKKIIFASSSSVYGNNAKIPYEETDEVDHPISPYAASKKSAELILHSYHHLYQFDVLILRFFTVYGPGQRPDLAIHKFFKLLYQGKSIEMYGDGSTKRDYTFIHDIISGVFKALSYIRMKSHVYEIVNLGNQDPVSLADLISTIELTTNKKFNILKMPMQEGDVNLTYASINKARQLFQYQPQTDLKQGLLQFMKWFENYEEKRD
jgi:UDP-glucuronate 4-epimerase